MRLDLSRCAIRPCAPATRIPFTVTPITGRFPAFKRFEITRLYAVPFADHVASVRVLEGRLRQSAIKNGQIRDQLLFATYRPL